MISALRRTSTLRCCQIFDGRPLGTSYQTRLSQHPPRSFSTNASSSNDEDESSNDPTTDPSYIKQQFRHHLSNERQRALLGGGPSRIDKQHSRGSLTARERLELLFDSDTFCEMDMLKVHRCREFGMDKEENIIPGDGVVTGHGKVNGRQVFAFSQVSPVFDSWMYRIRKDNENLDFFGNHCVFFIGLYRFWRKFE